MTATPKLHPNHSLDQFQAYLVTRNKSPNTICVYRYAVEQFYHLYPQLTPRNLQLYKVYLLEHYKPQTVNLRIRALNCFMEYRQASITPVTMIKIQQKTYLDKIISQADYEYLKRRIYIPSLLKQEFEQWFCAIRRTKGPLFLNRFGSPISPSGIRAQFKVFAARYNLDPEVMYPHSFRHRFAKNFIEKCGDIALLSDLLGHESIETTRIYLRRSSSEQYRIVNKVVDW